MKSFQKPANLDGVALIAELEAAGVTVKPNGLGIKCPTEDGNGLLWLDIAEKDESKAVAVVSAHAG
jgi:hypothetical protein